MIQLFLNEHFDSKGLIPTLDNIIRHLKTAQVAFEALKYTDLMDIKARLMVSSVDKSLVRCDLGFGSNALSQLEAAPEAVSFNKTFDSITIENRHLLPRLRYFDLLRKKIVTHFGNINIQESAGVICDSSAREGLISVLVSLGFKTILLFVRDGSEDWALQLGKYFIGVKIKMIFFSNLTQNQDTTSLIINALDLEANASLMSDLSYFNFMSPNGIIVDLASKNPIHPLLFEAEKAGLRTMKRRDVSVFYDYESLKLVWDQANNTKENFFDNYLEIETIDQ